MIITIDMDEFIIEMFPALVTRNSWMYNQDGPVRENESNLLNSIATPLKMGNPDSQSIQSQSS